MLKNSYVAEWGGEPRSSWLQSPSRGMRLRLIHQILPGMGLNAVGALISERCLPLLSTANWKGRWNLPSLISAPLQVLCSCLTDDCSLSGVPVPVTARLCAMMTVICFHKWLPHRDCYLQELQVFSTWAATNSISPEHLELLIILVPEAGPQPVRCFVLFFMSDRLSLSSTKAQCIVERHWKKNRFLFPFFFFYTRLWATLLQF